MTADAKRPRYLVFLLGALTTISPFSIDMYLPAFQRIADSLHTSSAQVALSLASYFIGMSVGQAFYGPFLDRFGRRRPLFVGLGVYVFASVLCAYSGSVEFLIAARVLQALGACAASVASTAMVRDFFPPEQSANVFSRLMLILSVSPLFAPTVGGWIVSVAGWRALFFVLAVIVGGIGVLIYFYLPEGQEPDPTVSLSPSRVFETFLWVARTPGFLRFALPGGFSLASLFCYLGGAPAIFMGKFQLSENQFGMLFAFLSIGIIGGSQVNVFLLKKFEGRRIFRTALCTQVLVGVLFLAGCHFGWYGLKAHIAFFFTYISCIGLVYPNAGAQSLAPFEKNVGSAASLLGVINMGVGSLASGLFGILPLAPNVGVASVFVLTSSLGLLFWWKLSRVQSTDAKAGLG